MTQESRLAIVIDSRQAKPSADELAKVLDAVEAAGVDRVNRSPPAIRAPSSCERCTNLSPVYAELFFGGQACTASLIAPATH